MLKESYLGRTNRTSQSSVILTCVHFLGQDTTQTVSIKFTALPSFPAASNHCTCWVFTSDIMFLISHVSKTGVLWNTFVINFHKSFTLVLSAFYSEKLHNQQAISHRINDIWWVSIKATLVSHVTLFLKNKRTHYADPSTAGVSTTQSWVLIPASLVSTHVNSHYNGCKTGHFPWRYKIRLLQ